MRKSIAALLVVFAVALALSIRYTRPDFSLLVLLVGLVLSFFGSYFLARATKHRLKSSSNMWLKIFVPGLVLVFSFLAILIATAASTLMAGFSR